MIPWHIPFSRNPMECPVEPTLLNSWLSIISVGLILTVAEMGLGELHRTPFAKTSWYSGSEWGWKFNVVWTPNFKGFCKLPDSARPDWGPTGSTLTKEGKVFGKLEEIPGWTGSRNGTSLAEYKPELIPLSVLLDDTEPCKIAPVKKACEKTWLHDCFLFEI